jgi:hypothetical protein
MLPDETLANGKRGFLRRSTPGFVIGLALVFLGFGPCSMVQVSTRGANVLVNLFNVLERGIF